MQACIQDPVSRTETDRELATKLARGDSRAVDSFYREHFDAIYDFVYFRVGRSRQDAEDVTEETFLLALRKIDAFEGRAPLGVWLRGIARNKCRERNKLIARRRIVGDAALDPEGMDALADLDAADLPQRVLESEEVAVSVSAALSQLPQHYKRVLVSKYVDEKTFAEIGSQEECSAKAAESMVQRAKGAFARMLKTLARRPGAAGQMRTFHG
jgi:RNA polymerase sigma factor (sigma-70 family)